VFESVNRKQSTRPLPAGGSPDWIPRRSLTLRSSLKSSVTWPLRERSQRVSWPRPSLRAPSSMTRFLSQTNLHLFYISVGFAVAPISCSSIWLVLLLKRAVFSAIIFLFNWIMSNAQYTNVNNVKRVKQTHDDKHNTKHDGSWFISAEKELKKILKLRT